MSLLVSIAHDSEMLSEKSNQKKLLKIMTIEITWVLLRRDQKSCSCENQSSPTRTRTQLCAEGISGLKSSFLATYS